MATMRPCAIATACLARTPRGSTGTTKAARISVSMDCMCRPEQKTPPQRGLLLSSGALLLDALELDVDAAVLLASFGRLVGRDGLGLSLADRRDLRGRDALAHQVVLHRGCAALGQLLVVRVGADRVGVSGRDHHLDVDAFELRER